MVTDSQGHPQCLERLDGEFSKQPERFSFLHHADFSEHFP